MIAKNFEHFLKSLSVILDPSVETITGLFVRLKTNLLSYLYNLETSPLLDVELVKIFCHSVGCCFVLLTMYIALQKFRSLEGTMH